MPVDERLAGVRSVDESAIGQVKRMPQSDNDFRFGKLLAKPGLFRPFHAH